MDRPARSVRVVVDRVAAPLPEDCTVRIVDGQCELRDDPSRQANFAVVCKSPLPTSAALAHAHVCLWGRGEMEQLRHRACAVGGDTIMLNYTLTDSCVHETFDGLQGTSDAEYTIYRIR